MIRNLQFGDLEKLKPWLSSHYPAPDLHSGLYCVQKALLGEGGEVKGAALLKLTCEATLILDPSSNELERVRLIKVAFDNLKREASEKFGLDQVHVFIVPSDEHYAELLKKHFQFKDATGIPLVYTR